MGHPMRLELTHVGLLVKVANCYTTKGALKGFIYKESWIYLLFYGVGIVNLFLFILFAWSNFLVEKFY